MRLLLKSFLGQNDAPRLPDDRVLHDEYLPFLPVALCCVRGGPVWAFALVLVGDTK